MISYASLKPRVEPQLQEIYRKFTVKLTEYEHELEANFSLKKFDPRQARLEITKRHQRQDQMEALRARVESEIDRVYAAKETKEKVSVLSRQTASTAAKNVNPAATSALNQDLDDLELDTIEMAD